MNNLTKEQITNSLRQFVLRRDELLHEDADTFEHHFSRFMKFCQEDPLIQLILHPLEVKGGVNVEDWWSTIDEGRNFVNIDLIFPSNADEELLLRYLILLSATHDTDKVSNFGIVLGKRKHADWVEIFRVLIIRPFAEELTYRLGNAANLATPEERAMQAVPLKRIPNDREVRIFLSHKSVDKPLVYRYYHALKQLGFEPWLDEPDMPAGTNLEREVFKGFSESCAAVFFITENFKDEKYLAAEVDYAVMQKRKKNKKFAIITLRYPNASPVPDLLTPYIYKSIENDLEGFHEILRALPIESGAVRWKAAIVDD